MPSLYEQLTNGEKPKYHENWDSKGRIYYTDDYGNKFKSGNGLNAFQKASRKVQAFGKNLYDWLQETNPESEAYKQKSLLTAAAATAPFGLGAKGTAALGAKLTPVVGQKIGQAVASGVGGGLVGGGAEGVARGLIYDENPIKTGLQDAALGSLFGGGIGLGLGQIGKAIAFNKLLKNPFNEDLLNTYVDDYATGLSNNAPLGKTSRYMKEVHNVRAAKEGIRPRATSPQGEYNFIGENAFNAPKGKLMDAKQMAMYGDNPVDIWENTGWFKGVDDKWRYEIPYGELYEHPELTEWSDIYGRGLKSYSIKLKDLYNNPELYKNYPDFAEKTVYFDKMPKTTKGSTNYEDIFINQDLLPIENPQYVEELNRIKNTEEYKNFDKLRTQFNNNQISYEEFAPLEDAFNNSVIGERYNDLLWDDVSGLPQYLQKGNEERLRQTLIHEIQHNIQNKEGFAKGGGPIDGDDYMKLAGEVEARLASNRSLLRKPGELKDVAPFSESLFGYDVKPQEQIVKFDNNASNLYDKLVNNGVVDLTNSFSKNPTISEVKAHIQNLINNGIKYDTLSPDWKIDIIGGKAKADHIVKSSQYGKMNKAKINRHNKYIASIEDLINNSTYTNNPKSNTKLAKKPNVDTYHYFETQVKIGNKQYKVILDAEQYKGESTIKPQTVHLYDVKEIK